MLSFDSNSISSQNPQSPQPRKRLLPVDESCDRVWERSMDSFLRSSRKGITSPHILPVYMEKNEDQKWIACSISTSGNLTEQPVKSALQDKKDINHTALTELRQSDGYSCPVFALRDIVHLLRNPQIIESKELPSEMFLYSQSRKSYEHIPANTKVRTRKKGKFIEKDFHEKIRANTHKFEFMEAIRREMVLKKVNLNMMVTRRWAKYAGIIVQHVLAQEDSQAASSTSSA